MAPTLASLPAELLCLVFEELCLQDMIALRTTRLQFLRVYLRYEQRLRRKQQNKILAALRLHLETWARKYYKSHRTPQYRQHITEEAHIDRLLQSPQDVWNIPNSKSTFTAYILEHMPLPASPQYVVREWYLFDLLDWRRKQQDDYKSRHLFDDVRCSEQRVARLWGLDERHLICLTRNAEVVIDKSTFKVYCRLTHVYEGEHFSRMMTSELARSLLDLPPAELELRANA